MKLQLIRHATSFMNYNGKNILVDPMLSPIGVMDAIPNVPDTRNNPIVELPDISYILSSLDGVLITHTHRDHYDEAAKAVIPKEINVFCQKEDNEKIRDDGFKKVNGIDDYLCWEGINIFRTGGQHGTGEIGRSMGKVSGFVLKAPKEPTVYITGDTIWCQEVENAILEHNPEIIICFAGGAQFSKGDPITMTKEDIYDLSLKAPQAQIIVTHMEAWNHCRLTRKGLKEFIDEKGIGERIQIPNDGDIVSLTL